MANGFVTSSSPLLRSRQRLSVLALQAPAAGATKCSSQNQQAGSGRLGDIRHAKSDIAIFPSRVGQVMRHIESQCDGGSPESTAENMPAFPDFKDVAALIKCAVVTRREGE